MIQGCGGAPQDAPGAADEPAPDATPAPAPDARVAAPSAPEAAPKPAPSPVAPEAAPQAAPDAGDAGALPTPDAAGPDVDARTPLAPGDAGPDARASSPDAACYSPAEATPNGSRQTIDCGSGCQDAYAPPLECSAVCAGPAAPVLAFGDEPADRTFVFPAIASPQVGCMQCGLMAWSFTVQHLGGHVPACTRVTASARRFVTPYWGSICTNDYSAGPSCAIVMSSTSEGPYVTVSARVGTPQGWVRVESAARILPGGACPLTCP